MTPGRGEDRNVFPWARRFFISFRGDVDECESNLNKKALGLRLGGGDARFKML